MIHAVDTFNPSYYAPADRQSQGAPAENARVEEYTTVTTRCDKEHPHTRACPHTVSTRPANSFGPTGRYLDERI